MNRLYHFFTDHLRSVKESYWKHMWVAWQFAIYLVVFCLAPLLVHSVLPGVFTTFASDHLVELTELIRKRRDLV